MEAFSGKHTDDPDLESSNNFLLEAPAIGENGVRESSRIMEMLANLDVNFAYYSEKLANMEIYRVIVSLGEFYMQNSIILDEEIEKALVFDLSLGYLDSEVTELKRSVNVLRTEIIDEHKKLHFFGDRREMHAAFEERLRAFEFSWKHLQDQLLRLERRLVNMRGTPFSQKNTYTSEDLAFEGSGFDLQIAEQQRLVLRMLDKSIDGELDLERQLLESKEREEELELFVEVALGKLLEAEHSSEAYKGIAKEMITRIQSSQFNMHCSAQREGELKSKLQSTLDQLMEKETALLNVEISYSGLNQSFEEKEGSEVKIKMLEGKLEISESMLEEVKASYDVSQDQLSLMENTVETLRSHVFMAEIRSQSAEEKLNTMTEENIELREEVTFLKGGDENVDKISLLEKQVRELEVQLQTAKASSEASLEQQNMLYTAIWDMETLIEELRSKVSKAENKADNAEKRCLDLVETNIKLDKEISCLMSNTENLVESLKEANEINVARAKDIKDGAKFITEVVVQLASERERIQNEHSVLARENKILLEELRKMRKICVRANQDNKTFYLKDRDVVVDDPDIGARMGVSTTEDVNDMETSTSRTASNQVDEPLDQNIRDEAEPSGSSTSDVFSANVPNDEIESRALRPHINKKHYTFAAVIVVFLSLLAININWQDIASVMEHQWQHFGLH